MHFTPFAMGSPVVPGRRCSKLLLPRGAGGKAEPNSCCTPVGDPRAGAVVIPIPSLMPLAVVSPQPGHALRLQSQAACKMTD